MCTVIVVVYILNLQAEYPTLFQKYDPRKDGKMTVDEWMSLATEEVFKKIN